MVAWRHMWRMMTGFTPQTSLVGGEMRTWKGNGNDMAMAAISSVYEVESNRWRPFAETIQFGDGGEWECCCLLALRYTTKPNPQADWNPSQTCLGKTSVGAYAGFGGKGALKMEMSEHE